jgi:GNAT superfamily N-acetyltransferase
MTTTLTIRPAVATDTAAIRSLAISNAMFEADDMDGFDEMMQGYLDGTLDGHAWIVAEDEHGATAGGAYYAPEPFADRMWNLYFIAVDPGRHRDGTGGVIIDWVEQTLRDLGPHAARVLIVETSSLDQYAQARAFYAKRGFDEEARIRDFYGPGDNKVVFWKSLVSAP